MEQIIIVSGTDKGTDLITQLLAGHAYESLMNVKSGAEARRILHEQDPDLVIINTPLRDEFGHELAVMAAEETDAGVLLMVKAELQDEIDEKIEESGVVVLPKPLSRAVFSQSVKIALSLHYRIAALKKANAKLQKKIDEIRLVDRAKLCLIQFLGMSEADAHRYIEKRAMDERLPRKTIAQGIIRTYE